MNHKYSVWVLYMILACVFAIGANVIDIGESTRAEIVSLSKEGNYGLNVQRGLYEGVRVVHKFGFNEAIGTSLEPIASNGVYRTPSSLTSLEILSSDSDDSGSGVGGQQVLIQGLSTDWEEVEELVELNGTTPVQLQNSYYRVYRMYVVRSGTYADQQTPSHQGVITLRESGAGEDWAIIDTVGSFGLGQTQIGVYTVPAGYTAYVTMKFITIESSKTVDLFMFQRQNANDTISPYSGVMRVVEQHNNVGEGFIDFSPTAPLGPFPEKTDIGFMASVAQTQASASVDFEIYLYENE